jgi:hypothetical protein
MDGGTWSSEAERALWCRRLATDVWQFDHANDQTRYGLSGSSQLPEATISDADDRCRHRTDARRANCGHQERHRERVQFLGHFPDVAIMPGTLTFVAPDHAR